MEILEKIQEVINQRKLRSKIINSMTIDELEKVYKAYVSKNLFDLVEYDGKKRKVDLPAWKLKFRVKLNVNNDQIFYIIPRLKKIKLD